MANLKKALAVLMATMLVIACSACGKNDTSESSGGGDPVVRIDMDIYNQLDEEYQFDTDYVTSNKNKFSGKNVIQKKQRM